MRFTKRKCRECGKGMIRLVREPGRTWPYKRLMLEIPAEFAIPTCDHCGEQYLDPERADSLDDVLAVQYREYLSSLFERAVTILSEYRSQRALERLLGLSQGYLSKIRARAKVPSESLVTQVVLIAKEPEERLREVETTWSSVPPAWLMDRMDKNQRAPTDGPAGSQND